MKIIIGQHRSPLHLGYSHGSSGATPISSSKPSFVGGYQSSASGQNCYVAGHTPISATQNAFIDGLDTTSSSKSCYINGNSSATSNISSYIAGLDIATSSKAAYIRGHQAVDNGSFMLLLALTNSGGNAVKQAYIQGTSLSVTGSQNCYIRVAETLTASKGCYMAGLQSIDSTAATTVYRAKASRQNNSSSVTSFTLTLDASTQDNDVALVSLIASAGVSSITGLGATWTKIKTSLEASDNLELWKGVGCTVGNTVITVNLNSSDRVDAVAIAVGNVGSVSASEQHGSNFAGTPAPPSQNVLQIGSMVFDSTFINGGWISITYTDTPDTFTTVQSDQGSAWYSYGMDSSYRIATQTGSHVRTINRSPATTVYGAFSALLTPTATRPCYIAGNQPVTASQNSYIINYTGTSTGSQNCFMWGLGNIISPHKSNTDIVATNLYTDQQQSGASTYTTSSINPAANSLVLVAVFNWLNGASPPRLDPSVAGCGMRWDAIASRSWSIGSTLVMTLFRGMSASPAAGPLTISFPGGVNEFNVIVDQFTGVDTVGINGAGALAAIATNFQAGTTSLTVTLSNPVGSKNIEYGYFAQGSSFTMNAGAGYTQLGHPAFFTVSEYKVNTNTVVGTGSSGDYGGIGVEIQNAYDIPRQFCCIPAVIEAGQGCTIVASRQNEAVKHCYISSLSQSTISHDCYVVGSGTTYHIQNFDTVLYDVKSDDTYLEGNILWPFTREARGIFPFGVLDNSVTYFYYNDLFTAQEGDPQYFTVPNGITEIFVECWGAEGGTTQTNCFGGKGGYIKARMPVEPDEVLQVQVGGLPYSAGFTGNHGGYPDGGDAPDRFTANGTAGGGSTSLVRANNMGVYDVYGRLIVAGAGGASAQASSGGIVGQNGGDGGYPSGGVGYSGFGSSPYPTIHGGSGGTQSNGGTGGPNNGFTGVGYAGQDGSLGQGGAAGGWQYSGFGLGNGGGGGGGGFYGGGGAWSNDFSVCGGGGGGSSGINTDQAVILLDYDNGVWIGSGKMKISWAFPTIVTRRIIQPYTACFITGPMPGENQLKSFNDCFLNGQSANTSSSKGCFIQGATEAFRPSYIEGRDPFIYFDYKPMYINASTISNVDGNVGAFIDGLAIAEPTLSCYIRTPEPLQSYRHSYIVCVTTSIKEKFIGCYLNSASNFSPSKRAFIFGVIKPPIDPKSCYLKA